MGKIGKHYWKKRMIGNPRMPGKIVKVHSLHADGLPGRAAPGVRHTKRTREGKRI